MRDRDGGRKPTFTDWEVVSVHTNSDAKGDYYYAQCALVVDGVVASGALSKIGTNLDETKGKLLYMHVALFVCFTSLTHYFVCLFVSSYGVLHHA